MRIEVECEAGYRGEETPLRLKFDDRVVEVAEVIDRWPAPDYCYAKLIGQDGAMYILRHDVFTGNWALILFHRHGQR